MSSNRRGRRPFDKAAGSLLILVVFAVAVALVINHWTKQTDASLQQQVLSIASQLHAPGDRNTMTAATSSLTMAQHMRYQIQQDLLQGMTPAQVRAQMVHLYGPNVLAAPSFAGLGRLAWLAPWLVLVAMLCVGVWLLRRGRSAPELARGEPAAEPVNEPNVLPDETTMQSIDARLRDYY